MFDSISRARDKGDIATIPVPPPVRWNPRTRLVFDVYASFKRTDARTTINTHKTTRLCTRRGDGRVESDSSKHTRARAPRALVSGGSWELKTPTGFFFFPRLFFVSFFRCVSPPSPRASGYQTTVEGRRRCRRNNSNSNSYDADETVGENPLSRAARPNRLRANGYSRTVRVNRSLRGHRARARRPSDTVFSVPPSATPATCTFRGFSFVIFFLLISRPTSLKTDPAASAVATVVIVSFVFFIVLHVKRTSYYSPRERT